MTTLFTPTAPGIAQGVSQAEVDELPAIWRDEDMPKDTRRDAAMLFLEWLDADYIKPIEHKTEREKEAQSCEF